jgi:phosphoglycerate dehydrogenase-like enzyme
MTKLHVAHHLGPAASGLLTAHPAVAEARGLVLSRRWDLPTDVDVVFALHSATDPTAHHVARPLGWPGRVKFVQLASSGSDGYPEWLGDGPVVASSAGTSAPAIAEFVMAALLMVEKRLPAMAVTGGEWTPQAEVVANPLGTLDGKTLGLLGVGEIGGRVAALAAAFGMTVIAHRRSTAPVPGVTLVPLDELLARSEHLVLAAPLTADTTGIIGAAALAKVKPGVHIVNIARGGLIDTAALIAALESGRVGFASLDVTDPEPLTPGHPLWTAPNVRITPHIAWSSPRTGQRIFALFTDNLGRFARGERLINQL